MSQNLQKLAFFIQHVLKNTWKSKRHQIQKYIIYNEKLFFNQIFQHYSFIKMKTLIIQKE